MVDRLFSVPDLAEWYDLFCPWSAREDFPFYLPYIMSASAVLDVGCGTGMLLHRARSSGHSGRLTGLDPAWAMLSVARRRPDIEWLHGDLSTVSFAGEFDLIIMTGHAFQVLLTDAELTAALGTIRAALRPGGTFAFETRNPLAREWESWTPANAVEVHNPAGTPMRQTQHVESWDGEYLTFTLSYATPAWPTPQVSRSTLRFLPHARLNELLTDAGLTPTAQYGTFSQAPITPTTPEIITLAHPTP